MNLLTGELSSIAGLPSNDAARQVSSSVGDLTQSLSGILNQMVTAAIEKSTASEFQAARQEIFPNYFRAVASMTNLIGAVVPKELLSRLTADSFCEIEADFEQRGAEAFGPAVRDEALFSVWTLRKANDLLHRVVSADGLAPTEVSEHEKRLGLSFVDAALWARFHVDCLRLAMRSNIPLSPAVLEEISGGLRMAVTAFAWMKQWFDLRFPIDEPVLEPVEWDAEDEALLADSMRDMAVDSQ
jgi:hypothetical protein